MQHGVAFYDSTDELTNRVSGYLSEGLAQGEMVVSIARPEHSAVFSSVLVSRGVNVDDMIFSGRLVLLDAEQTLTSFMSYDGVDNARLRGALAPYASAGRVYGEAVSLLWQDCDYRSAEVLEAAWGALGIPSLLCSYPSHCFDGCRENVDHVCGHHTEHYLSDRLITRPNLSGLVCHAAEAAVLSAVLDVAAGRGSWRTLADSVDLISTMYPEVLSRGAQDAILQMYEDVA